MADEEQQLESPESDAGATSIKERIDQLVEWSQANRLRALMMLLISLVMLATTAGGTYYIFDSGSKVEEAVTIEQALAELDRRAYSRAKEMAKELGTNNLLPTELLGGPVFVLGAAIAYEADENWEKDKKPAYLLAARYLEEAKDRGFPHDRHAEGIYLLARSMFLAGQYAQSRLYLLEALKTNADKKTELHQMLTKANLLDANPHYENALKHNQIYLADRMLSPQQQYVGLLERAQIMFQLNRIEETTTLLEKIPAKAKIRSEAIVIEGRILLKKAREILQEPNNVESGKGRELARPVYLQAMQKFREAQARDNLGSQATRKAMYLIGVCYGETGDQAAAIGQLERTRTQFGDTPAGLAAGFKLAEMLRQTGKDKDSVALYRRIFAAAGEPRSYSNPWISLDDFRGRMLDSFQAYLDDAKFDEALQLVQGFQPMFSKMRTIELRAQTQRAWAEWLTEQAASAPPDESRKLIHGASKHFRSAGYTYARLAKIRIASRSYPEDLWNSANNLLRGSDYNNAAKLLEEYLRNETRLRRPQALVGMGKAQLALGDIEKSVEAFLECIRYHPRDAAIYEARLWCAKAYVEQGMADEAEQLLISNLTGDTLTPASHEWRDSLFALGRLLHNVGRHEEAILKLEEAVERYPDTSQAFEGLYIIAEAYRDAAKIPQQRLRTAEIESVRVTQQRQIQRLLEGALKYYRRVQLSLNRREEEVKLSEMEASMLRNCYFSIGSVLFDLGSYEEAIKAFSDVSTRYQSEPLVLEAFVQIANCNRRLNRAVEARGALENAKVVLKRLPKQLEFEKTTNYSREEWEKLLVQLSSW